jgi:hypothetical protein
MIIDNINLEILIIIVKHNNLIFNIKIILFIIFFRLIMQNKLKKLFKYYSNKKNFNKKIFLINFKFYGKIGFGLI